MRLDMYLYSKRYVSEYGGNTKEKMMKIVYGKRKLK